MAYFELVEQTAPNAVIKVVGVGGGGGNPVAHMVNSGVEGVEFITANTDAQAIKQCGAKTQLQLGANVTKGLGAGANPEVGRQAALEDRETIIKALEGADMVFITAQLFARPTISIASDQLTRSHTKQLDFIQNNLNNITNNHPSHLTTAVSTPIDLANLPTPIFTNRQKNTVNTSLNLSHVSHS